MSDRANAVIETEPGKYIFLYTHWGGSDLPKDITKAIKRKQRWDDPSYLARIVFCTMLEGDVEGETGYGISTELMDNEYPLLVLHQDQTVRAYEPKHFPKIPIFERTFEEIYKEGLTWEEIDPQMYE